MENETLSQVLERLTCKGATLYTDEEKLRYMASESPSLLYLIKVFDLQLDY